MRSGTANHSRKIQIARHVWVCKNLGRRDKESTTRGGGTAVLDSRLGDAFENYDLAPLSNNRDRRSSVVAFSVVGTKGAGQLLGVEFKGWKGALSTGLEAKADAPVYVGR